MLPGLQSSGESNPHSLCDSDDISVLLERMLAVCAAVSGTVGYALVDVSSSLTSTPSSPAKINTGVADDRISASVSPPLFVDHRRTPSSFSESGRPTPPVVPPLPLLRGHLFGSPHNISASGRSYYPNQGGDLIMMNGDLVRKTTASVRASANGNVGRDGQSAASSSAAMEALLAVEAEVKRLDTLLGAEIASARVVVLGPFRKSSGGEVMSSRLRGTISTASSRRAQNSYRLAADSPFGAVGSYLSHDSVAALGAGLSSPTPVVVTIDHINTSTAS